MKLDERLKRLEAHKKDWRTEMGRPCEVFVLAGETTEQAIDRARLEAPRLATGYLTIVQPDEPFTA